MTSNQRLIAYEQAKSPITEAYRTFRTNIQFSKVDGELKKLLITSTGPGEGKSTIVANTAVTLAQSGKRVLIVDCDLRKPVQHRIFKKENRGLTNYLIEDVPLQSVVQDTEIPNLRILTSGPIPPNPSELLGSQKMLEAIAFFQSEYDYILFDAPPVLAVTDAGVLASRVDGVVMVVAAGSIRPEIAQHAKDLLLKANGRILGVVLNGVEIQEEYSYYYYYYGEQETGKHKKRKTRN